MKKVGSIVLTAVIAALLVFLAFRTGLTPSFAPTSAVKETVAERVMRTNEIRCGYSFWHPLMFVDVKTGEKKGIFHDLMEEAGKRLGLKIIWQEELGWGTVVESVRNGRVDMACAGYWLQPERIKHVSSTAPQLYASLYVWGRRDETRFSKFEDLNSEQAIVGTIDGGAANGIIEKRFPKAKRVSVPELVGSGDYIQLVTSKKADFIIRPVAKVGGIWAGRGHCLRNGPQNPAMRLTMPATAENLAA